MSHVSEHIFIFCRATNDRICRESPVACRLSRVTERSLRAVALRLLTRHFYIQILRDQFVFMPDNAPSHVACDAMAFCPNMTSRSWARNKPNRACLGSNVNLSRRYGSSIHASWGLAIFSFSTTTVTWIVAILVWNVGFPVRHMSWKGEISKNFRNQHS